jgi:branched-chain amino acid aminotransferase
MKEIKVYRTSNPKQKPDYSNLGFGKYFTDHMFLMDYSSGSGWHDPRIVPYGPLPLDPAAMVLHYAQETFEGMKAYRSGDGRTLLFRPWDNFRRLNSSDNRLCIPPIDVDFAVEAVKTLLRVDMDWMPEEAGTSMYIRPFVIATEPHLGVRASNNYLFVIILSPVAAYYPGGMAPVKIYVEDEDVRTVRGGTGEAKAGGNYAATIRAQIRATEKGYTQVLWLDGVHRKYIEEVGTMNVFFHIDDTVVTPVLSGSILPGITRKSCLEILRSWSIPCEERLISVDELKAALRSGRVREAFGTGTAAVISPIGQLAFGDETYDINSGATGPVAQKLYDELTGIQWGRLPDKYGWTTEV